MPGRVLRLFGSVLLAVAGCGPACAEPQTAREFRALAPVAVTGYGSDKIAVLNALGRDIQLYRRGSLAYLETIDLPVEPTGLAIHNHLAYVTTDEAGGRVLVYDLRSGALRQEIPVGHTPVCPVVAGDGEELCLACRFDNEVAIIDLSTGSVDKIKVIREPITLAVSKTRRRLYVGNHLPEVRPFDDEDFPVICAEVSVIDMETRAVRAHIALPNGSHSLRDVAVSPDDRYVVVSHIQSNFTVPPLKLEHGAMNMNVISILDTDTDQWLETVSLDDPNRGAANPWALAFSQAGDRLLVTHAGTGELSVIAFTDLLDSIQKTNPAREAPGHVYRDRLQGIRQRIALASHGPRSVAVENGVAYVGGYFSDSLDRVPLNGRRSRAKTLALHRGGGQTQARLGEQVFNDASLCLENWQSCASCHPDGRRDAMYWDLSNDGLGTFKDTKSLLMATRTPPVMWRGVRVDAMSAIRAGIHHIQFSQPRPGQAEAVHAYLDAMPVTPSPHLHPHPLEAPKTEDPSCAKCHAPGIKRGQLTAAAQRGKSMFEGKAGCVQCHPHPLFTNLQKVDPGLGSGVLYDVPSLIEVWRTAPYLHNGDALTLRQAITDYNWMHKRGHTQDLSEAELADLIAYVKSL